MWNPSAAQPNRFWTRNNYRLGVYGVTANLVTGAMQPRNSNYQYWTSYNSTGLETESDLVPFCDVRARAHARRDRPPCARGRVPRARS